MQKLEYKHFTQPLENHFVADQKLGMAPSELFDVEAMKLKK